MCFGNWLGQRSIGYAGKQFQLAVKSGVPGDGMPSRKNRRLRTQRDSMGFIKAIPKARSCDSREYIIIIDRRIKRILLRVKTLGKIWPLNEV